MLNRVCKILIVFLITVQVIAQTDVLSSAIIDSVVVSFDAVEEGSHAASIEPKECLVNSSGKPLYIFLPHGYTQVPAKESLPETETAFHFFKNYERVEWPEEQYDYGGFNPNYFDNIKLGSNDKFYLWYGITPEVEDKGQPFLWALFTYNYDFLSNQANGLIPGVWECAPASVDDLPKFSPVWAAEIMARISRGGGLGDHSWANGP